MVFCSSSLQSIDLRSTSGLAPGHWAFRQAPWLKEFRFRSHLFFVGKHVFINGLVSGKIYRKPRFLPLDMGVSCRFSLKPIHWFQWQKSVVVRPNMIGWLFPRWVGGFPAISILQIGAGHGEAFRVAYVTWWVDASLRTKWIVSLLHHLFRTWHASLS